MTAAALTGVLAEIAEVAGEVAAVQLAAAKGGTSVYIPARISDRHWLVECVGRKAAEKICAHYAVEGKRGARLDVPLAGNGVYPQLRRAVAKRVADMEAQRCASSAIARATGITQRAVHKRRAKERRRKSGAQQSLF